MGVIVQPHDLQKEEGKLKPPHLAGVEVGEREQVLQVEEPLGLRLLQHDHGVRLPEEGASGAHLPHLDELHHHLAERGSGRSSRADASERGEGRGRQGETAGERYQPARRDR